MATTADSNDWRRQGQERYLLGKRLVFQPYRPYREGWDHDHCEFCGDKLSVSPGDVNSGYVTEDGYHWVCQKCFDDFEEEFGWVTDN